MSKLACEQKQVCTNVNSEAKRCKGPYTLSCMSIVLPNV